MSYTKVANTFSKEQIDTIFNRWYSGEKTNTLLSGFKIEKIPGCSFAKHFPPIIIEDSCPYCSESLYAFRSDSVSYKKHKTLYDLDTAHCLNCGHFCKKNNCKCNGCILQREEAARLAVEEKAKKQAERAEYQERMYARIESVNFDKSDLIELIYFYSFCYQSTYEDITLISPLALSEVPFMPTSEWDSDCIDLIMKYISPLCEDEKLFRITEEGSASWSWRQVFHRIKIENLDQLDFLEQMLSSIKARLKSASVEEKFEFVSLCEKLMICECTNYLEFMRGSMGLPHEVGVKTIALFKKLIKNWRIDQIYNIIWGRCKDALAYKVQNGLPGARASNFVIGAIDKYIDRAIQGNWEIKPYKRDHSLKQSVLSYIIFNKILGFGGCGIEYNFQDLVTKLDVYSEQPEAFNLALEAFTLTEEEISK